LKETATCRTGGFVRSEPFSTVCYGECRNSQGNLPTDRQFTGQRLDDTGLYYYGARYYDAEIGRFISADTFVPWSTGVDVISNSLTVNIIPQGLGSLNAFQGNYPDTTLQAPVNPQTLNRYSYVLNNPLTYNDPYGWWTFGFGINIKISVIINVSISHSFAVDGHGNWAVLETKPAVPGAQSGYELSYTAEGQWANADNVYELEKGVQVEPGFTGRVSGAAFGLNYVENESAGYEGVKGNIGLGASYPPVATNVEVTETDIEMSKESWENLTYLDVIWFFLEVTGNEEALEYFYDYYYYFGW
jgi:RHS repeat-associated protein